MNPNPRKCAFTDLLSDRKLVLPDTEPGGWIKLPCNHLYKRAREQVRLGAKLKPNEPFLALFFYLNELHKAGLCAAPTDEDRIKAAGLLATNRYIVESHFAKDEKRDYDNKEDMLEELMEKRREVMK
jgi:hypothetical protein